MQVRTLFRLPHLLCRVSSSSSSSQTADAATAKAKILEVGTVLRLSRRFSEADVQAYSTLSGDANPVHFDRDFASGVAGFLGPVVHGLLVASLFPRVIAFHFPGAVYVSQKLDFKLPVYMNEEIVAEVEPVRIRENKKKYIAKFSTKCFRVGDKAQVLEGEATAILPTLELRS